MTNHPRLGNWSFVICHSLVIGVHRSLVIFKYPDLDSNQGPDLRRVRCIRYTIGTGSGVRGQESAVSAILTPDSCCQTPGPRAGGGIRTHIEPHYGCGAFLCRATPASAGAQGFEPCAAVLEAACSPRSTLLSISVSGGNRTRHPEVHSLVCTPLHHRHRQPVVPGGIEPPISSVSGRRLGHSTTGLSLMSTPARSRTRNASFEARHDVRFTTRANSGR